MANLYFAAIDVLKPLVGPIPAEICVRSACVQLGKECESLVASDFDVVADKIRSDLGPFASSELIDQAVSEIKAKL